MRDLVNSSIVFIGEYPQDWNIIPLKHISKISKGKKPKEDFQDKKSGMVPYLGMEYLRSQTKSPTYVKIDDGNVELVNENDLLVLWDGSNAGEIIKAKYGALSSTLGKINLIEGKIVFDFAYYLLKSAENYLKNNTVGMGIPHVDGKILRNLPLPIPSLSEQTKIANYLDHKTTIIDKLIADKEKLVSLLQEQRQAIINEAVTKGLDPNAKMKDSGIEWLGEIPEGWDVVPLKFVTVKITDGAHVSPDISKEDYPFISTVDLDEDGIDFSNCLFTSEESYKSLVSNGCKPEVNDILYSKDGTIGKTSIIEEKKDFVVASSLIIVRPNKNKILSKYFEFALKSSFVNQQIDSLLSGVALRRISLTRFSNLQILVPPKELQDLICKNLSKSNNSQKLLIRDLKSQIKTIKTYRQSLISEAVTGKIDLRNWKAPEFEEDMLNESSLNAK